MRKCKESGVKEKGKNCGRLRVTREGPVSEGDGPEEKDSEVLFSSKRQGEWT